MNKSFLAITIIAAFIWGCSGQSSSETESKTDSTTHEHMHNTSNEAVSDTTPLTAEMEVFFPTLNDGAIVTSPLIVEFGVKGMEVEPAGAVNTNKGHHHLIIDGTFTPANEVVAADATHIHYGKGQVSDTIELSKGEHTLTLQFANGFHQSYGHKMSKTIKVTVK